MQPCARVTLILLPWIGLMVSGCAHPPPPEQAKRPPAEPGAAARLAATSDELIEHEPYLHASRGDRLTPGDTSKEPTLWPRSRTTLADDEVVSVAHLANRLALEHAQLAERRAQDERVRSLARLIVRDARRAQAQTERLLGGRGLTPVPSSLAAQLRSDAEHRNGELDSKQGRAFDRAWIDAELRQRRETLQVIDDRLLPSASDARVETLVRTLRNDLERRGTRAVQLKGDLDK